MGKLFGTDGIRGVVNAGLDADLAYKVGLAAAQVLAKGKKPGEKPLVTIGKDTRISGDLLKGSLIAGLCTAGADVLDLGTLPTPGVAWVTVDEKADAGIVISASHNPFEHNGIKIFNGQGYKLSDELEEKIEDVVLFGHNDVGRKTGGDIGKVSYVAEKAVLDYIDHLESTITSDLAGLRILVDCANGASYTTAAPAVRPLPQAPDRRDQRRPGRGEHQRQVRLHPYRQPGRHGEGRGGTTSASPSTGTRTAVWRWTRTACSLTATRSWPPAAWTGRGEGRCPETPWWPPSCPTWGSMSLPRSTA